MTTTATLACPTALLNYGAARAAEYNITTTTTAMLSCPIALLNQRCCTG
eukprot:CAMPEP_0171906454 /NCGR_PEP_ID=MMETSP0993-20121228/6098_1 /TAXON_ID=483369 /ORGANISM="non described non described, Strain CCMP2098" /LENGTH=48 /DNA_ID= /DNA_START= /DNA_END= /DNA_ORIENTATION=